MENEENEEGHWEWMETNDVEMDDYILDIFQTDLPCCWRAFGMNI
jgi:hypothetical protein